MSHRNISRRGLLAASVAALAAPLRPRDALASAHVVPDDLSLVDITFSTGKPFVKRATVLAPTHLAKGEKVPTLVLFHGLGEAKEGHESGAYAWLDRYGVGGAYQRLRHPPVASILKRKDLTDARAAELNDELPKRPFGGMVIVCPFTPNVWSYKSTPEALDALASFVDGELLPRVAADFAQADISPARTGVDGCSLGGFVSLEVFARKPERWGTLGVVQPAISHRKLADYVEVIANRKGGAVPVHVETSTADPYLSVSRDLHAALGKRGLESTFVAPPGPHDQPFLRDVGSIEMLLWHDRQLRRRA